MKKFLLVTILCLMCLGGTSSAKQWFLTCDPYPVADGVVSFTVIANGTQLPDVVAVKDIDYPLNGGKTGGMILWVEVTPNLKSGTNHFSVVTNGSMASSTAATIDFNLVVPSAPALRCVSK